VLQRIRAWWAKRKKREQEKYAEDHAWIDSAELDQVERNFDERADRRSFRRR
jgi:hypothetical protein